jgi:hypothetical protein
MENPPPGAASASGSASAGFPSGEAVTAAIAAKQPSAILAILVFSKFAMMIFSPTFPD